MKNTIPRILVGGTHSGAGKTTVTLGLLSGFKNRGLKVQPYKVGPDYIDPSLHAEVAGRPSRNLDSFLCSEETLLQIFIHGARRSHLSVVEGVMGFFDGYSGTDERGSSAHIARMLDIPSILVVDAGALSRSVGAMVLGYQKYDPRVRWGGVFLNRVAGAVHLRYLSDAIRQATGLPVIGHLFQDAALRLPERHLGLVPNQEKRLPDAWRKALDRQMNRQVDWKKLISLAKTARPLSSSRPDIFEERPGPRVRIGIAQDKAFCFYYQDNLDLLKARGAEIIPFKPTVDSRLPPGVQGIYFGGGFPEVHAGPLSQNKPLKAGILDAARKGIPIYAECGGLMYLGQSIRDFQGRDWKMAGVFPWRTVMEKKLKLAYVQGRAVRNNILFKKGAPFKGHVFHFSRLDSFERVPATTSLFNGQFKKGKRMIESDGWQRHNALAGYAHVHFGEQPALVDRWLDHCRPATDPTLMREPIHWGFR